MTERVLEFGTAKAGPGERGTGFIKVGELCDGSPINMPVIVLNGKNLGPKLFLISLEDGDEYPGALGALEACNNILPDMLDKINGSIVYLPAAQISGFRGNPFGGGMRNSPLDIDQGARIGRPGNPYGKHGDQLGYQITKLQQEYDPDFVIRFHGCKQMYGIDRVLCLESPPGSKRDNFTRAAVTKPGTMVMLTRPARPGSEPPERPLSMSMESNGGDNGIGNGFNGDNMRDGLLNVMRHLKMIPGKEIKVDKIQYVSYKRGLGPNGWISSSGINTTRGGFFKSLVEVMDKVKEGQVIGEIRNFFGELMEEIKSPIDGLVLSRYIEAPHIGSGQWRVFAIAEPIAFR